MSEADAFNLCPKKHTLPHKTPSGECTPLRCVDQDLAAERKRRERERRKEAAAKETALAKAQAADEAVEDTAIKTAVRKNEKWLKILTDRQGLPEFKSLEEAEKWTDSYITSLLPTVALRLKQNLLYGTDSQQRDAIEKILSATGRSKREAATASAPPIVIQVSGGISLPWRRGEAPSEAVVDAPAKPPGGSK